MAKRDDQQRAAEKSFDSQSRIPKKYQDPQLQRCFAMGWEARKKGATLMNSHFTLFNGEPMARAWQAGYDEAEKEVDQ